MKLTKFEISKEAPFAGTENR